MRRDLLVNITLAVVSVSAVILTATAVKTAFVPASRPTGTSSVTVRNWAKFAVGGHRLGPPHAPVTIVEFADFQCPYCAQMVVDLAALRHRYPNELAVVFRQFPLERIHAYARDAAIASECGGNQGRFEAVANGLFRYQDSLGVRPWTWFAAIGGVADTLRFASCTGDDSISARIDADVIAGNELHVRGTPTIMINGALFALPPSVEEMDSVIQAEISRHQGSSP